ncbi:TPA: sigma-70 family RNA polymerase sigma factor [Clostridioides difficile]|uniref:sigma-70 family RNA polymerase sigma factor n=1 Tax=Clostridioides difficile TaxID=1496 RepID=UPI00044D450A|nr:sigma-70 family RNA polymerase sigma factor [Clostridioides difficile]OFU47902.1 hypothetical protein HMPREF3071_05745 [Clostridium sp. HMSC19A11]AXU66022.1 sigma-70 family RNA polymerase sigma factor [Clostridioides difficile]EJX3384692.1 sigma-70 family RNA polymerase sigma factor [Clostridioides difficile]EZR26956.1 hypothetical protein BG47_19220 [Clostridioides difficile]MBF8988801.1 sigma-70 family RNA polymerase sigma factor [Clostridioides difficile]
MNSKEEINRLVEENINLVHYYIKKYFRVFLLKYPYLKEDLFQEGCIGIFQAAKVYDSKKGKFATIACKCIHNSLHKFASRYVKKHYKENSVSLEQTIYESSDNNDITLKDNIAIKDKNIGFDLNYYLKKAETSNIKDLKFIISMYIAGYSQWEIGDMLGISQTHVCRRIQQYRNILTKEGVVNGISKCGTSN